MDKGNCTAGVREAHGYQGLPKGSVRMGLLMESDLPSADSACCQPERIEGSDFRGSCLLRISRKRQQHISCEGVGISSVYVNHTADHRRARPIE